MSDIILQGLSGKLNYNVQVVPGDEYTLYGEVISNGASSYTIYEFGTTGNVISQTVHPISSVIGVFQINLNLTVSSLTNRISIIFAGAEVTCIYLEGNGLVIDDDPDDPDDPIEEPDKRTNKRMTFGEIRTEVLTVVDGDYATNANLYINKGLRELSSIAQVLTRTNITISSGRCPIPDDCLIIRDVYFKGQKLSRYEGTNVPVAREISREPLEWLKDGIYIKFYPNQVNGSTVQIVYIKNDATMVDDDDVPTLEYCEDFLIAYAKYKVLVDTSGLTDLAIFWKQEAEAERLMWEKLNKAQNQRPRRIRAGRYC